MTERSNFQQRAIKNYYHQRKAIALQRVQELVTELYLSEGKKRQQHWRNLASHLKQLGVPQSQIDHLLAKDSPELLARVVKRLVDKGYKDKGQ